MRGDGAVDHGGPIGNGTVGQKVLTMPPAKYTPAVLVDVLFSHCGGEKRHSLLGLDIVDSYGCWEPPGTWLRRKTMACRLPPRH